MLLCPLTKETKMTDMNAKDNSLLLPGLATADKQGEKKPFDDGSGVRSALEGKDNPPVLTTGDIKDNNLTNQDGQSLDDHHERLSERDSIVIDKVSGNPVLVQNRFKEDKLEEFKKMLDVAHSSLDGAGIGDIGVAHPYFGLMNKARLFGKNHGLI